MWAGHQNDLKSAPAVHNTKQEVLKRRVKVVGFIQRLLLERDKGRGSLKTTAKSFPPPRPKKYIKLQKNKIKVGDTSAGRANVDQSLSEATAEEHFLFLLGALGLESSSS